MAHKEERFLFVVYPLLCLLASFTLAILLDFATYFIRKISPRSVKVFFNIFSIIFSIISFL